MSVREPAVAGFFYPRKKEKLLETLKWCYKHELGPKILPEDIVPDGRYNIKSAIAPHAGYIYSGPCAAHTYLAIKEDHIPETIILIGPNHHGLGPPISVYTAGTWRTPIGDIKVDEEIAMKLVGYEYFTADKTAHIEEHSLEVQLPFMIYTFQREFKIVPIVMMDQRLKTARETAGIIFDIIDESKKDIIVVASSDMSHYVPYEEAYTRDQKALERAESLDIEGFYETIEIENVSACGVGPMAIAMLIAKFYNSRGALLQYYTSGDITGDRGLVVGYASLIYGDLMMAPRKVKRKKEIIYEAPLVA